MRKTLLMIGGILLLAASSLGLRAQVVGVIPYPQAMYYWDTATTAWEPCPNTSTAAPSANLPEAFAQFGLNASLNQWTPYTTCPGGGPGGISQLTQDVLAGPGTGSLPAEVVGIRTEPIPDLTPGYLHWTGTVFVWDTPSSAGCTTTGTGIFQLSNGSGGCEPSPADYGVTVTNGYTFPATGSGGAANDATFNITLTENGSSDHSAGIYTILTDNGANAYGADWNYIAASDGTRSAGWLTILDGGIGTFGANWELDSSTGSTLPSHNAANDSSNMWLNFVGGGGENTITYTNSASFEVSTTCDNFATNSCNAEFSLDGNSDSSENFIVTTNVGTPADSTAGNIELDASGTAGGGAISLDASGGISLADSSSAGIAINEGSTGPIIVAANNIELLTLTPADATLNSSEICTMATGCGSSGVTTVNSNTGALQINFSSGAGSCSYSGGLTTCSITGSGSGGGTVSDFIASAGSWPTWLVPSVATSTTTPTLSVSAGAIPNSALANDTMTINSTVCTLGGSCTVSGAGTPGGTSGQSQYNNAGAFGGYTMSGDATLNTSTGAITVTKSSGTPFGTAAFATLGNSGTDVPQLSSGLLNASVLPLATSGAFGAIKPDGTTCTVSAGVLTCSGTSGISGGVSGELAVFGGTSTITSGIGVGNTGSDIPQLSGGLLNNSVINWASPSAIGGTSAAAGTFSSLKDTGAAGAGTYCLQITSAGVIGNTGAACPAAGGIGGSGTAHFLPEFTAGSTIANSPLDDGVTTAATLTTSEPFAVNTPSLATQIPMTPTTVAPNVIAGAATLAAPPTVSTAGVYELPAAPGNGVYTGTNTSGVVATTFTPLNGAGAGVPTGPSSSTSGDCVKFTGTAGQLSDSGAPGCVSHNNYWSLGTLATLTTSTLYSAVYYEQSATTLRAIVARLSGTISCTAAPVVTIVDLGTSPNTAYGSGTVLGSLTTATSDGGYSTTGLTAAVSAGHYLGVGFSAGTCVTPPTIDVTATLL